MKRKMRILSMILLVTLALSLMLPTALAEEPAPQAEPAAPTEPAAAAVCEHDKLSWTVKTPARCNAEGVKTAHCDVCGQNLEEAIPADINAHHYIDNVDKGYKTEPTCISKGLMYTICEYCRSEGVREVEKAAHSFGPWEEVFPSTCAVLGREMRKCTVERCGYAEVRDIQKQPHQFIDDEANGVKTEPDCVTAGLMHTVCEVCSTRDLRTIPALGHDWDAGEVIKEPDCETAGEMKHTCQRQGCNATKTEEIPALGHDWVEDRIITAPGCGTEGEMQYKCQRSGCTATKTENIPATGKHSWGEWKEVTAPSCTGDGKATRTCSGCGLTESKALIGGHIWGSWTDAGDGYDHYRVCQRDGSHKEVQPHSYGPWEIGKKGDKAEGDYYIRWCRADGCAHYETCPISSGSPKTGDSSNILLWSAISMMTLGSFAASAAYLLKKNKSR